MNKFRVCLFQERNWTVAQCLDVDVATQGGSEAEALANIQEALALHFQAPTAKPLPPVDFPIPEGACLVGVSVAV